MGLSRDVVALVLVQLEGHAGLSAIRVGDAPPMPPDAPAPTIVLCTTLPHVDGRRIALPLLATFFFGPSFTGWSLEVRTFVAVPKTIHIAGCHQPEKDSGESIGLSYRFRGVPNARTGRVPCARTPGYQLPESGVPSTRG